MDGCAPCRDFERHVLPASADGPREAVGSPREPSALRKVLGRFATGVAVVTCASEHGPVGMTVNSFTSLSLDPPLVMWSPAKSSRRAEAFRASPGFAIHVLAADQQDVADAFMRVADAFAATEWRRGEHGVPLIEGCLARLECLRVAQHEAGDHTIEIGRVVAMASRNGDPLLYYRGRYDRLR